MPRFRVGDRVFYADFEGVITQVDITRMSYLLRYNPGSGGELCRWVTETELRPHCELCRKENLW